MELQVGVVSSCCMDLLYFSSNNAQNSGGAVFASLSTVYSVRLIFVARNQIGALYTKNSILYLQNNSSAIHFREVLYSVFACCRSGELVVEFCSQLSSDNVFAYNSDTLILLAEDLEVQSFWNMDI